MGYFVIVGVLAFIGIIGFVGSMAGAFGTNNKLVGVGAFVGATLLMALVTVSMSYKQVEAGNIGVVYEFGEIVGQIGEGVNFVSPWQEVRTENIRVRKSVFADDFDKDGNQRGLGRIEAASLETQDVFLDLTLNWTVSPNAVQGLYRNVGPNFFDILIPSRVQQHAKAEIVKYSTVAATQQRETIRRNIESALADDLGNFSIEVVSVQIDGIDYREEFANAIEAKQVSEELAKKAENDAKARVAEATGQADAAIQSARGRAESVEVEAVAEANAIRQVGNAQADANSALAASITPTLVEYEAIKKLEGVSVAYLPADGTTILDPTRIFTGR